MIFKIDDLNSSVEDIAEIERHCFSTPWSAEQIMQTDDSTVFFLAKKAGVAVGYAGMYTVLDEGYVTNIGVMPDFRRQGLGRKLLEKLVEYSQEKSLSFLSLEVRVSNFAAINLYKDFDFKEVGKRKGFYSSPKEDALIMTRYFK